MSQVCRVLEKLEGVSVSRSLVDYYGKKVGEFEPLVPGKPRRGQGRGRGKNMREYSVTDVVLLRWLIQLARQGLAVRKFYKAIAWLRERMPEALMDPEAVFFLTDNDEVGLCWRKGEPIQLTGTPGQILLALAGATVREVLEEAPRVLSA